MEPPRDCQQKEKEIGESKRPRSFRSQGRRCFQKEGVVHRVKCSSKMQPRKAWMLPIDCPLGVLVEGWVGCEGKAGYYPSTTWIPHSLNPLTWVLLPLLMGFS